MKKIFGLLLIVLSSAWAAHLYLSNIELTQGQLLCTYFGDWIGIVAAFSAGVILVTQKKGK